jgi:hypothetical protein
MIFNGYHSKAFSSSNRKHSPNKQQEKNRDIENKELHETTHHHNFAAMEGSMSHMSQHFRSTMRAKSANPNRLQHL